MAYIPLYQKFYTTYHLKPDGILKPENIKYKVFLKAVANYALIVPASFNAVLEFLNFLGAPTVHLCYSSSRVHYYI